MLFVVNQSVAQEAGKMTREMWFDLPGGQLANFTGSSRYWQAPDTVSTFDGAISPVNVADDYASRTRAYLTAPVTGNYTFWISSDDDSELYLSTDDSKFNRVKIASLAGYVEPFTWSQNASQQSVEIPLVEGSRYFVEVLHKDGYGGDHFELAWQVPGAAAEVIPAGALESFTADANDVDNDDLPDTWEVAHGFSLSDNGTANPEQHPLADPDHDGLSNLAESRNGSNPNPAVASTGEYGKLTREIWTNLPAAPLSQFTSSTRYWDAPDSVSSFSGAASPADVADLFASRVRGYVTAPVTGTYTFWLASDDDAELYLSTDDSKFNRLRIASLSGYVNRFAWDVKASQKSVGLELVAGQRYFIEALHKDNYNGDHVEIAWQVPGGMRQVIPPYALESFVADANDVDGDELRDNWEAVHGFSVSLGAAAPADQHPLADPDHDGYKNIEESEYGTNPRVRGGVPGTLLLETWNNLPGIQLKDLKWNTRFLGAPDSSELVDSAETAPDRADEYGSRMRGYVIAPVSGEYRFYVSGDDECELWLSTGRNQFAKQRIASQPTWSDRYDWNKFPTQKSAPVVLEAGKKYYIEALQKELHHGDHLEVAWQLPGATAIEIIPGSSLESYAYNANDPDGDNMPDQWEESHALDSAVHDAALDPDMDGIPNGLEFDEGSNPQVKNSFAGALLHELWWNVPAYTVSSPITRTRMLQPPDEHTLAFNTQGPVNYGGAYADRYRGYITAPATGEYKFWAIGDEEVEVWLSPSANKFKKELIIRPVAQIRDFDADLSMASKVITLEAGQRYYIEILHVNHHGGDFCEVAWQVPGGQREIIPGSVLSSFKPVTNDLDDDGLPDDWEVANGLNPADNGLTDANNGADGDLDGDGLTNAEEFREKTRADLADTDGDGVSDRDEIELLETPADVADVSAFTLVETHPGAAFSASAGSWTQDGGKAIQGSVRGWLEYPVNVAEAGIYEIDLGFTAIADVEGSREHEVVFSVDGAEVGREVVTLSSGATAGAARILTPWVTAGSHTVRVFIDNSHHFRRISVDQFSVYAAEGVDGNGNNVPDWVDNRLKKSNRFFASPTSITSPVCLEGKARWAELASVAGQPVLAGIDGGWFANIVLDPEGPTTVTASLENGAIVKTRRVEWVPVNLLESADLTIRQGDSLKLTAFTGSEPSAAQQVTLSVDGQSWSGQSDAPLVKAFETPGQFEVVVTHSESGVVTSKSVVVNVVGMPVVEAPVCVVGFHRVAELPGAPQGAAVQIDGDVEVRSSSTVAGGAQSLTLRLNSLKDLGAIYRLGDQGPVLGKVVFHAMRIREGNNTGVFFHADLGSNSFDLEMPVIVDGLKEGITFNYDIFMSGVTFDDGSVSKILSAGDFNSSGEASLHFYKAGTEGSNCHRNKIKQGNVTIAHLQ